MAITVLTTPQLYQPVYNPMYCEVQSNLTSQEGFNFLFDLYVNGTFVTRDKLLPRPGTSIAVYSPARVLESYVNSDKVHNITEETASANCVDKYKVVVGEEYVVYWDFDDTQFDSYTSTSYTVLSSTSKHPYVIDDQIVVSDTVYGTFNGVHKVVDIIDDYKVLINKTFTSTPTNPGRSTWSDKRKTAFISAEQILDVNTSVDYTNIGNWTMYGPDGCAVKAGIYIDDTMKLVVPDVGCNTAHQFVTATNFSLIPGRQYLVATTINNVNDPSGEGWYVRINCGGNFGQFQTSVGATLETITCGTGTDFQVELNLENADTGVFGSHSISISGINLILLPATIEAYDWNAVIQYEDVPTFDYTQYQMDDVYAGRFLTKRPSSASPHLTTLDDRGSIGWLNVVNHSGSSSAYYMLVEGIDADGSYRIPLIYRLNIMEQAVITNNPSNRLIEFPAYPWNLNQQSQAIYGVDVIDSNVASYYLQLLVEPDPMDPGVYEAMSERKFFTMDYECSRYSKVRFMFLNSLGQYDYYNATLLGRTNINATRDSYVKTLPYNYSVGDRGKTVINTIAQESYTINTNWMDEATASWLSYEFFTSNDIYVLDNATGAITPIILDTATIEVKKEQNGELIQYEFAYSKAVPLNTQRG